MSGKRQLTDGKAVISALASACLMGLTTVPDSAWAAGYSLPQFAVNADPEVIWENLITALVVIAFLGSIVLWVGSVLRSVKNQQRRRNAFVGSALNHLGQGIVMLDAQKRLVFCNDRYLEIYGLSRAEIPENITGPGLRELRRHHGMLDETSDRHYRYSNASDSFIANLPNGRQVQVKLSRLPNGGSIGVHEDCTEQRQLAGELESTKKFLETVVDNIPVSLMVQRVSDGKYVFANRSAEVILNCRREDAIGRTVSEMLKPEEARLINNRDQAAIRSRGLMAEEHPISTRDGLRLFLTRRVAVLDEKGQPQYLIKTHEDVTDRR